jgi:hypothetical protein
MVTDPDLLARLHQFPLIRDGRVKLQNRSEGYSLFDTVLDQPIVRIRPAGAGDKAVLLYPDPQRVAGCRQVPSVTHLWKSTKRSCTSNKPSLSLIRWRTP